MDNKTLKLLIDKKTYIGFLSLVLIFMSCSENKKETQKLHKESKVELEAVVKVNKLRMRDEPNLQSSTLAMIPQNSKIVLTGEKSDTTHIIPIDGRSEPHYWYEVVYQEVNGWVYGGGIEQTLDISDPYNIIPGTAVGEITKYDTEASLIAKFGSDQVIRRTFEIGDNIETQGNVLFPNTDKELKIVWEENDFENLFCIDIDRSNSLYHYDQMKIGSPLTAVEKMNGGRFSLFGFDWAYSGKLSSWENGKLNDMIKPSFSTEKSDYHNSLKGDQKLYSDNYRFEYANPYVSKIRVYFN